MPLVSTEWLAAHLHDPDLVALDASFYLPTEKADAHEIFKAGHIPGARFFDIEKIADDETDLPHMVPAAGRFSRMMAGLGITPDHRVVFYDQKGLFSAARGWWLMDLFGHEAGKNLVLDGGLPKWRAEHHTIEVGEPHFATARFYPASLHTAKWRGVGDMIDLVASGRELVLDARSRARFFGQAPEPRPGLPGGHMPGARNLPATDLLRADQTMLAPPELRAIFAAAGDDGGRQVVTSCGTGVTAAILSLGRAVAGLPQGALYDGAWTEWASRADTPKTFD